MNVSLPNNRIEFKYSLPFATSKFDNSCKFGFFIEGNLIAYPKAFVYDKSDNLMP